MGYWPSYYSIDRWTVPVRCGMEHPPDPRESLHWKNNRYLKMKKQREEILFILWLFCILTGWIALWIVHFIILKDEKFKWGKKNDYIFSKQPHVKNIALAIKSLLLRWKRYFHKHNSKVGCSINSDSYVSSWHFFQNYYDRGVSICWIRCNYFFVYDKNFISFLQIAFLCCLW